MQFGRKNFSLRGVEARDPASYSYEYKCIYLVDSGYELESCLAVSLVWPGIWPRKPPFLVRAL